MIHPIQYIIELVSLHFGVSVEDIIGKCRKRRLMEARHAAIYLIKKYVKSRLKFIGSQFSGRDHASVLHSITQYQNVISSVRKDICSLLELKLKFMFGDVNYLKLELSTKESAVYIRKLRHNKRLRDLKKIFNKAD